MHIWLLWPLDTVKNLELVTWQTDHKANTVQIPLQSFCCLMGTIWSKRATGMWLIEQMKEAGHTTGATKVRGGGGRRGVGVRVCLFLLVSWADRLAGWDSLPGWQACLGPVSALSHTIVVLWDWWGAATGRQRPAGKQEEEEQQMRSGRNL